MKNSDIPNLLKSLLDPIAYAKLTDTMIFRDESGKYELFGKYIISELGDGFAVQRMNDEAIHRFHNLKPAVAWCIMDKRDRFYDAAKIKELDILIVGLSVDLLVQERLMGSARSMDDYEIHAHKFGEATVRRKRALNKMDSFIQNTKKWQLKRFNNSSKF